MIVIDLQNQAAKLVDFTESAIHKKKNGEQTLSFTAIKTERNKEAYDLLQDESIVKVGNNNFIIKMIDDNGYSKEVTAITSFFECIDDYVNESWPDGLYTIEESLDLAFSTSEWGYLIESDYPQRAKLEDFGRDNAVSMLNKIINAFNSEYEIDTENKKIKIKRQIGNQTDFMIKYKYNMEEIHVVSDSSEVKTRVELFYNLDEFGNYNSSIVYISPEESKYRRPKWRAPIFSDVITTEQQAISTARLVLKDTPDVTITTKFTTLQRNGYNSEDLQLGNGVYLIDERTGLKMSARITEIIEYPYTNESPEVTVSSFNKLFTNTMVNQSIKQAEIENTAVIQSSIYNGCTISKEEGFKAVSENGVEAFLNATEGIAIKRDGKYKFYASATEDELVLDGKLNITSNDITMLEGFKDDAGGTLKIYDNDGLLNVRIGSNKFSSTHNGGSLVIYADNATKNDPRLELLINDTDGAGEIFVMDEDGNRRISLHGVTNGDTELIVQNDDGSERTVITPYVITIDNSPVITEVVLDGILQNIYDEFERLQEEIDDLQDQIDDLGP